MVLPSAVCAATGRAATRSAGAATRKAVRRLFRMDDLDRAARGAGGGGDVGAVAGGELDAALRLVGDRRAGPRRVLGGDRDLVGAGERGEPVGRGAIGLDHRVVAGVAEDQIDPALAAGDGEDL